jgi:hypothetical protein
MVENLGKLDKHFLVLVGREREEQVERDRGFSIW